MTARKVSSPSKVAASLPLCRLHRRTRRHGTLHKGPDQPLTQNRLSSKAFDLVGGYALQPVWADGHSSGLFSFEYLRRLGEAQA